MFGDLSLLDDLSLRGLAFSDKKTCLVGQNVNEETDEPFNTDVTEVYIV